MVASVVFPEVCMSVRLACLAAFVAVLPVSVDAPRDSVGRRGQTRIEAMGGGGQYGVVTYGCEGQVVDVVHRELATGGLVVEHETANGIVLGVRGGEVRHKADERVVSDGFGNTLVYPGWESTNRYVNPFVAYEHRYAGLGAGWLNAEEKFVTPEDGTLDVPFTAHLRFGDRDGTSYSLRFMEDVPLESEGHLSMVFDFHPSPRTELGAGIGMFGPYDGGLLGLKGRFWLTPEAAAQVRIGLGANQQYNFHGGLSARWPARR